MLYLSLLLTILSIPFWKNTCRSKWILLKISILIFGSLFISGVYLFSDRLTGGRGIDESVIYHLRADVGGAGLRDFQLTISLGVLYLLTALAISVIAYKVALKREWSTGQRRRALVATTVLLAAYYINPGVADALRVYSYLYGDMPESGIAPDEYISFEPSSLVIKNKKNIVYIYLESFERTYLNDDLFPGLAPNIREIESQSLTFTDIRQVFGSGWTIAGMVNTQCGIPLVTPGGGNSMSGTDKFLPKALCLGDILKANGYELDYLGGASLKFAGKGKFYWSHGFTRVEGIEELSAKVTDHRYRNAWGLYDDTLFDLVKDRYDERIAANEPFGLFVLTLDTHHPTGNLSKYCRDLSYRDGRNQILNSVHCADSMVAELVSYIRQHKGYAETIIVISSDHLAMPNTAWDDLKKSDRRNLLMIISEGAKTGVMNEPAALIDVAPTVLGLMSEGVVGLGFGRNLLRTSGESLTKSLDDIDEFLRSQRVYLSKLWDFPTLKNGMTFDMERQKIIFGDRSVGYPALITLRDSDIDQITFDSPDLKNNLSQQVAMLDMQQEFIWVDSCAKVSALVEELYTDSNHCVARGRLSDEVLPIYPLSSRKPSDLFHSAMKSAAEFLSDLFRRDAAKLNPAETREKRLRYGISNLLTYRASDLMHGEFIIASSGRSDSHGKIINIESGEVSNVAKRGLSLYGLSSNSKPTQIRHLDTCSVNSEFEGSPYGFQDDIDRFSNVFGAFVILAHDSAVCSPINLSSLFARTGLEDWRRLDFRTPYIAIISGDGQKREYNGLRETVMGVEVTNFIKPLP